MNTRPPRRSVAPRLHRPAMMALEPIERRLLMATISGAVFNDYDANFVRDIGEPGIAGWTVYVDENNNDQLDVTSDTAPSTNVPLPIPDDRTTRFSTLDVSGLGNGIQDVNLSVNIAHTYNGDLDVFLISPAGTRIEMFTDVGGGGDGLNITLDDEAAASVSTIPATTGTQATGTWRPEGVLAGFDGQNPNGQWRLEWTDDAGGDSGTLNGWSLTFSSGEQARVTGSTGDFSFTGLPAGTFVVRQIGLSGFNPTGPAGGFHSVTLDTASSTAGNVNFGARQDPGNVSGVVFGDYNANGTRESGEPGLGGWTVYLDANDNSVLDPTERRTVSAPDGSYGFDVPPGTFTVRELLPSGWVQTAPGSGGVTPRPAAETNEDTRHTVNTARRYTSTEVIARVSDLRGLRELDRYVTLNHKSAVARLVDTSRSTQMFKVNGSSLVELSLRPGADVVKTVNALQALPFVQWAAPNYIVEGDPRDFLPNDPSYGSQYHHPLMDNDIAWDTTLGDPRITIGVTDDGVALAHPDLYQNIWINQAEIPATRRANLTDLNGDGYISMVELNDPVNIGPFKVNDINADARIDYRDITAAMGGGGTDDGTGGWLNGVDEGTNSFVDDIVGRDFWNNDNISDPASSGNDHGTHVAGIAAARTNNGVGVAGTAGGATIVPLRFYSTSGGTWTSSIVNNAYTYAANNNIKIVTTSYNVDGFTDDPIFEAGLEYMYSRGVLHFNSAGNNGALNPPRQKYDTTLYVVNTQSNDTRNTGSNYGWGVDLSAPGTSIFATALGTSLTDFNYENKTGTSMATPNAAGVAALIWSKYPNWTREQVAAQIVGTADNIDALNPSVAGLLGSGRVNSARGVTETVLPPKFKTQNLLAGLPAEGSGTLTAPTAFTMDVANVFDPATVVPSSFEIRGDGLDDTFGTPDDVLVPFTLRFGDNATDYRVGTNRLFFTITGSFGSDTYRFSALPTLRDPFGQALDGNRDGVGGDALTRTFSVVGLTNSYRVTVAAGQTVGTANFGNRDVRRPVVTGGSFAFLTGQSANFAFDENVGASLASSDVLLENLTTSTPIASGDVAVSYDAGSNTARFAYTAVSNGVFPDGNYRATLAAGSVADLYGNALLNASSFDFFVLAGDANRDRSVDIGDFSTVAANFNGAGDYAQGDFDYSGTVDIGDFSILAAQFNKTLPAARPATEGPGGAVSAPVATAFAAASPFSTTRIGIDRVIGQVETPAGGAIA